MKSMLVLSLVFALAAAVLGRGEKQREVYATSEGDLVINLLGHASMYFEFGGKIIQVDPCGQFADYSLLPKADIIFITHHHPDHLDTSAVSKIMKDGSEIILTKPAYDMLGKGTVMGNYESKNLGVVSVETVPAYNTTEGREIYHPKGRDNGYILTFGDKRVYIAGDTEDIPEMDNIKNIDIAFLPMNQPYTMTPKQTAAAALRIMPKVLYPYHFGETNTKELEELLAGEKNIELKIRDMK